MAKTHGPMTAIAFHDFVGWLEMRLHGGLPDPKFLCQHLPQGVLAHAVPVVDPVDGSAAIALSVQPIRPERLHLADREGDNSPARPRTRYWEPEAVLLLRMALANGGTMFVDDDCTGKTESNPEGKWHYPEIFGEGISLNRVFMDAAPGDRVRVHVDRSHPFGHHDCRRRLLHIETGNPTTARGVSDFLDIAVRTYERPNPQDGLTGPQRFHATTEQYRQVLTDALAAHTAFNPSASSEQVARWHREKHPV
ncbi:hypothetical protein C5L14_14630 [Labrys okinawensis]|uniref:Uncharacterized protein n=1 Tax=Labrys okinawensis TaxID=346911 RepID=A0A2S9QB40_9HYPH|nr:hypothetical protein [Labrys okinawensis]PRH86567.1 hypothetical protein C5L14_14630 [Labrys okinawensis]